MINRFKESISYNINIGKKKENLVYEEKGTLTDKGQSNFHIGRRNLKGSYKSAAYNGQDIKRIHLWKKKNSYEPFVVCGGFIIRGFFIGLVGLGFFGNVIVMNTFRELPLPASEKKN